jgi:hypothetical protein
MNNKAPEGLPQGITTRAALTYLPSTMREADRSVEFILSTEAPANVWSWERFDVIREVLVAEGVQLPANKQIPLQDSHDRSTVKSTLGSVREIRVENNQVVGRLYFARSAEAVEAFEKIKDGHIDSGSVGYSAEDALWIDEGQRYLHNGVEHAGPMQLTRSWSLKEYSLVAIGADPNAKARTEIISPETTGREAVDHNSEGEKNMDELKKPVEQPQTVDTEAIKREAVAAEQARASKITDICNRHNLNSEAARMIAEGVTIEAAQELVLKRLEERTVPVASANVEMGETHEVKERAAMIDGALIQILGREKVKNPAVGAESMRGITMTGIASRMLRQAGVNTDFMSKDEIVTRALSIRSNPSVPTLGAGNFSSLLANVAEKVLLTAWSYAPTTYQLWCKIGSLPDFKAAKRVQVSAAPDMLETPEFAEVKYGKMSDRGEDIQLVEYARRLVLTRQAIINDDLDYFNTLFTAFGARAGALTNKLPYAVLAANANLADGNPLFHTGHTANTAFSTTSAGVAVAAFGQMKALAESGEEMYLNVMPRFCLVGYANWVAARIAFESMGNSDADKSSAVINPFNGIQAVFDANITTNSGKQHYYVADPSSAPTVEVAFLNGRREPILIQEETSPILGVAFTGILDVTAKALQREGIYRNQGG